MTAAADLYELLQMRHPLSNIIVPFPDSNAELPVAFVSGVLNLEKSLRHNGKPAVLEAEVEQLKAKHSGMGEIIDLTKAASELKIDTDGVEEKEIKENWSEKDEELFKNRALRVAKATSSPLKQNSSPSHKYFPDDIESILRAAEEEELGLPSVSPSISKVSQLRNECLPEKKSSLPKLPKSSATSSSVMGDIVERKSEVLVSETTSVISEDEVSKRVLLNEIKAVAEKKVSKFKQSSRQ